MNAHRTERTSHPSAAQVETLIEFLERKPSLAKGFSKNQSAKQAAHKDWENIAVKLNSMGGGTVKTAKKWTKYWSDKKSAVKKKAAARAAFRNTTGLGMVEGGIPELSNLEERIIVLMGGEAFATGDTHLQIQPFYGPSQDSPSILAPVAQASGTCTNTPDINEYLIEVPGTSLLFDQVINTAAVDLSLGHRVQSESMGNILGPETEIPITTSPTSFRVEIRNSSDVEQHMAQESEPARNATHQRLPNPVTTGPSSRLTSPRRPRRRILQATRRSARASPPSQRRTNLLSMADKFLQLEQQRLDLDSRMVTIMERNSERDHMLVESNKAIAEALSALAEIHIEIDIF